MAQVAETESKNQEKLETGIADANQTDVNFAMETIDPDDDTEVDRLKGYSEKELSSMLTGHSPDTDRPDSDWRILQALFEKRGATREEAKAQIMLDKKYSIGTYVTPEGVLGMYERWDSPRAVTQALEENKNLPAKVLAYLQEYISTHPMDEKNKLPKVTLEDVSKLIGKEVTMRLNYLGEKEITSTGKVQSIGYGDNHNIVFLEGQNMGIELEDIIKIDEIK